jgi:hypothetical protein
MVDFRKKLKPKPRPPQIKTAADMAKAMFEPGYQFSITSTDELANQVLLEARANSLQRDSIVRTAREEALAEVARMIRVLFRRAGRNEAKTAVKYLGLLERWMLGEWEPCADCQADPSKGKCKCLK